MKPKIIISLLCCLGWLLSACSPTPSSASATTSPAAQTSSGVLTTSYDNALSVEMQLAYGTVKLEGSANAIDSQSAAQLLPLWKAVRSLSASDAAAAEEIQAVYRQIQESMSAEQLQAIAAMQLTSSDVRQLGGEMGQNMGTRPTPNATLQAAQAGGNALPADFAGGFPGGGDPGGMPPMGQTGGNTSGSAAAGANSAAAANPLLDAVISYLQSKLA